VGQNYAWTRRDTATLALSYSLDSYDFSDGQSDGIAYGAPWEKIHTLSISNPLRKGIIVKMLKFVRIHLSAYSLYYVCTDFLAIALSRTVLASLNLQFPDT